MAFGNEAELVAEREIREKVEEGAEHNEKYNQETNQGLQAELAVEKAEITKELEEDKKIECTNQHVEDLVTERGGQKRLEEKSKTKCEVSP